MTGFTANSQALLAKAGYDEDRAGVLDGLRQQVGRARATEDCFGLIGMQAGFFTGYDDMVGKVDENVGKAAEYLRSAADRLTASAEDYAAVDQGWARIYSEVPQALPGSTFGSVSPGQAAAPEIDAVDTAQDAAEAVGDFQDASSLPEIFVAGVGVRREVDDLLAHPMQGFWDNGLGFLVEWCMYPFRPLFEQVTGDPDQMRATGDGWQRMGEFVKQLADSDAREQEALLGYWEGEAAQAQDAQKKEFQEGLRALGDCCAQLKEHLYQVADFFEGLWDILVDIVREFVEGLIVTWLAALAVSALSFGSSVAAAWATSAARLSVTLSRILMQISRALQWLVRALNYLRRLHEAVTRLVDGLGPLTKMALRVTGGTRMLSYLRPDKLFVRAATGLTGTTPGMTAFDSGTELATDVAVQEAGEEAAGENRREQANQDAMDVGFR
ncbi:MAG TPA: hypothetical protein VFV67_00770 [Actinophytocola sp.]|uniref:WXG100 family type VII secretion target n=1 Tax=Actinophytocola sp. TaxID=1872138 RepID=UPI002DBC9DDE|nr:hypothetical protein [Actinophytocola sp.]HEU5469155.1 hypothetical protein [Actinophytocola sp.]